MKQQQIPASDNIPKITPVSAQSIPSDDTQNKSLLERLQGGFLGFWVTRWRVTFLFMFLIVIVGIYSVANIPKESSPTIEFGIIGINTVRVGVNPLDIDNLITEKIEQAIEDIDGIKKLTSNSSQGFSNITAELETDVETNSVLVDIQDAVDKVSLPSEAEDPRVTELSTDNERVFNAYIYAPADIYSFEYLLEEATNIKAELENVPGITRVDIAGGDTFELRVIVDIGSAERLGLSLAQISQSIRSFNTNQPLGNYTLGDLQYDYRIQGEYTSLEDILETPLVVGQQSIKLGDISRIEKVFLNTTSRYLGFEDENALSVYEKTYGQNQSGESIPSGDIGEDSSFISNAPLYHYIDLTINKNVGASIFDASAQAQTALDELLKRRSYEDFGVVYANDLADTIGDDYRSLSTNGLTTIILVFLCMLFFVGSKESIIASISIPLAFFVTFFVLDLMGLSLNFLTNFSLIITFGIAIDTTIVIIEGAHEKIRMGYNPRAAVLLAVRDYKRPVISGTSTTLVVFLPLLTLPGVLGKFLAYIPITIFLTLLAALFISLTVNSALYLKLSKRKTTYEVSPEEPFLDDEEKELLALQSVGKTEKTGNMSRRQRFLDNLGEKYSELLGRVVANKYSRITAIFLPLGILVLSFVTISPKLGFELFPSGDSTVLNVSIQAEQGTDEDSLEVYIPILQDVFSMIPEAKFYVMNINGDTINATMELYKKDVRRDGCGFLSDALRFIGADVAPCLRLSNEVEAYISTGLTQLEKEGLTIVTSVQAGGPPGGSAVGIKLIAQENSQLDTLTQVANDFEEFLESLDGTKNVRNSSESTPGQFVFSYDRTLLQALSLTPQSFQSQLFASLQGIGAGEVTIDDTTSDIIVTYVMDDQDISPQDVENVSISTPQGNIRFGDVSTYSAQNAIASVSREDTNIIISVSSDVDEGITPDTIQGPLADFAEQYDYPEGISFTQGGETAENADLIASLGLSFGIALILIYMILVLQFNSYLQPVFIMYSVVMALLGVNLGLGLIAGGERIGFWLLKVPYSLSFAIGFFALTGIVVNDAIVIIDRINRNVTRGMDVDSAIKDAGRARLQPIILTTITTVLGLTSVATQDEFFAGLAFTVMFGLFVASLMTLFVVPALYHDTNKFVMIIKRTVLAPLLFFAGIAGVAGLLIIIGLLFGTYLWESKIFLAIIGGFSLVAIILYTIAIPYRQSKTGQTPIQKILGLKTVRADGSLMSNGQSRKRLGLMWFLFIGVGVIIALITVVIVLIVGGDWKSSIAPAIAIPTVLLLFAHIFSVWLDNDEQSLHDRQVFTKVIDISGEDE